MSEVPLVSPVEGQRRAHERFEVTIPVDCTTQQLFLSNHVCNISRGGLFIRSDKPLPLETEVALVLRLPEADLCIRARGRVVWNYDIAKGTSRIVPGSGIRFIDMSASDRAALEGYLKKLADRRSA
jgi:type IV pilus assembly protein PilZ